MTVCVILIQSPKMKDTLKVITDTVMLMERKRHDVWMPTRNIILSIEQVNVKFK